MTTSRMTFLVDARDQASRVLSGIGDSAIRLHRRLGESSDEGAKAMEQLRGSMLSLVPAALPVAASMAPIAVSTAAAGAAVGVYMAALGPQVGAMNEATKAEEKYQDAVEQSGPASKEAADAQAEYARQLAKLPPATQKAAAQMSVLKDAYEEWSKSLAADTMAPFTKGLALATALLPKLSPMVRGTSAELDRFVTLAGGGMASPGFDALNQRFTDFATGALRDANNGLIHFLRTSEGGNVGSGVREFMDFARAQGPVVRDTFGNLVTALTHLLEAGGQVGVGMLQVVNVMSQLVAAVPPSAIATFLQLAIAVKAVRLAVASFIALRAGVAAMGGTLLAMRTAAGGAAGGLASATAAFGAMSKAAKVAMAGTAIGLVVLALNELASIGKQAPADLDKMTSSLSQFGQSGKLSGEAARILGDDFKEFDEALRGLARPGQWDQIQQGFTQIFNQDSTPVKRWTATLDGADKALASMVQSGNADMAAEAFSRLSARAQEQGLTTAELKAELGDYNAALKDQAFEQEMAAQSMGMFGLQAQEVQAKLAGQKAAADGLRQSIHALDQAHLMARGGVRGMEAAIDAATQSLKDNGRTLNENTEKGRANNQALDDLANATQKAMEAKYEETGSWGAANQVYERGRVQLEKLARQLGMDTDEVRKLSDQILMTPNKTAKLNADKRDLEQKLKDARAELARVPDSRKAAVRANIRELEQALKRAKDKLNALDGDTATTYVKTVYTYSEQGARQKGSHGTQLKAGGGLVVGPGTGTSDDVPLWASNGEFVIKAASVDRYGIDMLRAINEGRFNKVAVTSGKASVASVPVSPGRPAAVSRTTQVVNVQIDVSGALDPAATARAIQQLLLNLKRIGGVNINLGVG